MNTSQSALSAPQSDVPHSEPVPQPQSAPGAPAADSASHPPCFEVLPHPAAPQAVSSEASIENPATSVQRPARKVTRNGKIARLPKLERDLVNRMLYNHFPDQKIADALEDVGIKVTARNVSNWKTRGGFKEW